MVRCLPSGVDATPDESYLMELYVGNLPWSVTDESLTALFAAHGQIDRAKVVMDRETGRSRGFAFVTVGDENVANAAIAALNGKDVDGRALTVRKAEPRPPRQEGGGSRGGGGGGGYGGGGGAGGYRR
jgi:RNA recognition motif-containing protein